MKKLLAILLASALTLSLVACSSDTQTDGDTADITTTSTSDRAFIVGDPSFAGEFLLGWGGSGYDTNVRKLVDGNDGFFTPSADNELVLAHYMESYETEKIENPNYDPDYQTKVDALTAESLPYEKVVSELNDKLAQMQAEDEDAKLEDADQTSLDEAKAEVSRIADEIALLKDTKSEVYEVWTFKLKEDIKFSDGEAFTTADIAFTYYMYSDPTFIQSKGSGSYQPRFLAGFDAYYESVVAGTPDKSLLGMEVIDDYTIAFTISEPTFTIKTEFNYYMYAEHQLSPDGAIDCNTIHAEFVHNPIGIGPYKIVEWNPGSDVKLTINEYYTGNMNGNTPNIENIVVQIVPSETKIDMLLAGEIDLMSGQIQESYIDSVKAVPEDLAYNNYVRHGYGYIGWHNDFGATQYPEMRLAIAYAFDKETFVDFMTGPYGSAVPAPYSPHFWMIDEQWIEENIDPLTFDPAKARSVLEEAGWEMNADGIYEKNGETAEIRIACGNTAWSDYLNNTLANTVEESGIKFVIDIVDFAVLLDHYNGLQPETDRMYNGFALGYGFLVEFDGYSQYHSNFVYPYGEQTSVNTLRWVNEENDRLLEEMRFADPTTEEGKLQYQTAYQEWVKLANQENPLLPIYANDYHDLYNADLENFNTGPMWGWPYAIIEANWAE